MFKSLQVLRTKIPARVKDFRLRPGTRVVVVNFKDGVITARVQDNTINPNAQGLHLTLTPSDVEGTRRGRPTKEQVEARTSRPKTSK